MKPVSKTAYYCCGVRMQDAASPKPLIGDNYAKLLLGKEGMDYWNEFKDLRYPSASSTVRHFLIDNYVKEILQTEPESTVILIGAGLDSRAFRLPAGKWIEIDEPAVIEYKNSLLPLESCPNKLERIAINFETEKLIDKLSPHKNDAHIIIIIEGVLMYLNTAQKNELLETLTTLFPAHVLFCDLMKKNFFEKFGKPIHDKLVERGASFTDMINEPWEIFLQHGYRQTDAVSTMKTAVKLGLLKIPLLVFYLMMRKYIMGYAVYRFEYK